MPGLVGPDPGRPGRTVEDPHQVLLVGVVRSQPRRQCRHRHEEKDEAGGEERQPLLEESLDERGTDLLVPGDLVLGGVCGAHWLTILWWIGPDGLWVGAVTRGDRKSTRLHSSH